MLKFIKEKDLTKKEFLNKVDAIDYCKKVWIYPAWYNKNWNKFIVYI